MPRHTPTDWNTRAHASPRTPLPRPPDAGRFGGSPTRTPHGTRGGFRPPPGHPYQQPQRATGYSPPPAGRHQPQQRATGFMPPPGATRRADGRIMPRTEDIGSMGSPEFERLKEDAKRGRYGAPSPTRHGEGSIIPRRR